MAGRRCQYILTVRLCEDDEIKNGAHLKRIVEQNEAVKIDGKLDNYKNMIW